CSASESLCQVREPADEEHRDHTAHHKDYNLAPSPARSRWREPGYAIGNAHTHEEERGGNYEEAQDAKGSAAAIARPTRRPEGQGCPRDNQSGTDSNQAGKETATHCLSASKVHATVATSISARAVAWRLP